MITTAVADIEPEIIFPFAFAILLFVVLPVVAILTKHQQRMAELMRHQAPQLPQGDQRVLEELARLRDLVAQQSLMIDSIMRRQEQMQSQLSAKDEVQNRLSS